MCTHPVCSLLLCLSPDGGGHPTTSTSPTTPHPLVACDSFAVFHSNLQKQKLVIRLRCVRSFEAGWKHCTTVENTAINGKHKLFETSLTYSELGPCDGWMMMMMMCVIPRNPCGVSRLLIPGGFQSSACRHIVSGDSVIDINFGSSAGI